MMPKKAVCFYSLSANTLQAVVENPIPEKQPEQEKIPRKKGGKHYCAAYGCHNTREGSSGQLFASFPKDLERCHAWIRNSARKDVVPEEVYNNLQQHQKKDFKSARGLYMCEEHFTADNFVNPADKGMHSSCSP